MPGGPTGLLRAHGAPWTYLRSRISMNVRNSERVRASGAERAEHVAGDHRHAALVDAARRHALVHGLDHHADAAWPQLFVDAARDLRGHLFLDLEATCVDVDHARELADADDAVGRQVSDVGAADDRRHVMLTMRLELDVAQHDHLVVARGLLERPTQVIARVDPVPGEPVAIRGYHPARRFEQPRDPGPRRPSAAACERLPRRRSC